MTDKFEQYLEKAVQETLKENTVEFGDDNDLKRSYIKRHVQLLIYTKLDRVLKN